MLTSGGAIRHDSPTRPAGEHGVGSVEVARFIDVLNEVGQRRRTQPCRATRHGLQTAQVRLTTHKEAIPGKTLQIMPELAVSSQSSNRGHAQFGAGDHELVRAVRATKIRVSLCRCW